SGGGDVGGLEDGKVYFVRIDGNDAKFFGSKAQAEATSGDDGVKDLTSVGTGTTHSVKKTSRTQSSLADPNADGDKSDKAATSDGDVEIAGALAVAIVENDTRAFIDSTQAVTTSGALSVVAHSANSATAKADGSSTIASTTDSNFGIAVGVNVGVLTTEAYVGGSGAVSAGSVKAEALMSGDKTFVTEAISGASGGNTGVAGSLAINVVTSHVKAEIADGASVTITGGGDVALSAKNLTSSKVEAKAAQSGGGETGVGISVALNIVDASTLAAVGDGATLTGGADLALSATGSHAASTTAEGGGVAKDGTGVGGAVALTVADNATEARLGTGSALSVSGDVTASADHHGSSTTTAKGDGTGTSTAVGAAVALSFVGDTARATTARDITAGKGVSLAARGDGSSKSDAIASAKGADKSKESSSTADGQSKQQTDFANAKTGKSKSSGQSAGDGSGQVGVAAALALNVASSNAQAGTGGVTIDAGKSVDVLSANNMDASATADGSAATGAGATSVGVAVAINVADMDNKATLDGDITAEGASAKALMKDVDGDKTHKFAAKATSGASGGDTGVAGSFAL